MDEEIYFMKFVPHVHSVDLEPKIGRESEKSDKILESINIIGTLWKWTHLHVDKQNFENVLDLDLEDVILTSVLSNQLNL